MGMTIGEASKRSACSVPTIRYYEEVGLLGGVGRTPNGRRAYGWPDVSRLTFIRRSRDLGLSLGEIRTLLAISDGSADCADARDLLDGHLVVVRKRREELQALEASLRAMIERCSAQCAGAAVPCTIFEEGPPA
jgi:DNA-binding transcriptional MerR regulator